MDQKYNGWTNYETWRIGLEIFDGYEMKIIESANSQEEALEMVEHEYLKDYVEEILLTDGQDEQSLVMSYAMAFVDAVNFYEISEHLQDDIKRHFEYEKKKERKNV